MARTPSVSLENILDGEDATPQALKRAYVSHACQRCRKAKIKCDGDQPCAACLQAKSKCDYDQKDKRRRQYRNKQHSLENYDMYKSVLERIWQATLRGEEQQLLDLIRLGMSISTLAHHIDDSSMSRIETPASESPTNSNKLIQEENLDQPMASRSNVSRYSTVASQLSTAEVDQLLQEANASAEQSTIPLERHGWHPSLQIPSPPASFAKQSGLPQALTNSAYHPRQNSKAGSTSQRRRNDGTSDQSDNAREKDNIALLVDRTASKHSSPQERSSTTQGVHMEPRHGLESLPSSATTDTYHIPRLAHQAQMQLLQRPEWQILPNWEYCPSPLGRVYTDFYRACHVRPGSTVSQPRHNELVDVSLYFRERQASDPHNADTWACELESSFGNEYSHITKLARVYTLARYMRWLLNPTYENYVRVPHMMRPTLGQQILLHPSPIDLSPIRPIREALLKKMRDYVGACSQAGMDVSWPLTVNEALVMTQTDENAAKVSPQVNEQIFISPRFAEHISHQPHWRLGRSILNEFPELEDSEVTIAEEDRIEHNDRWL